MIVKISKAFKNNNKRVLESIYNFFLSLRKSIIIVSGCCLLCDEIMVWEIFSLITIVIEANLLLQRLYLYGVIKTVRRDNFLYNILLNSEKDVRLTVLTKNPILTRSHFKENKTFRQWQFLFLKDFLQLVTLKFLSLFLSSRFRHHNKNIISSHSFRWCIGLTSELIPKKLLH